MKIFLFFLISKGLSLLASTLARILMPKKLRQLHAAIGSLILETSTIKSEPELRRALVAGEDHRFYFHGGVDPVGILRAIAMTLLGRRQGGSTIEQQLVRTVTGNYRPSVDRKIREILLASTVSEVATKTQLLEAYLHIAYFGSAAIGIKAARATLGMPQILHTEQSCLIVSYLKYPRPMRKIDRFCTVRQRRVLHILRTIEKYQEWLLEHNISKVRRVVGIRNAATNR